MRVLMMHLCFFCDCHVERNHYQPREHCRVIDVESGQIFANRIGKWVALKGTVLENNALPVILPSPVILFTISSSKIKLSPPYHQLQQLVHQPILTSMEWLPLCQHIYLSSICSQGSSPRLPNPTRTSIFVSRHLQVWSSISKHYYKLEIIHDMFTKTISRNMRKQTTKTPYLIIWSHSSHHHNLCSRVWPVIPYPNSLWTNSTICWSSKMEFKNSSMSGQG